MVNGQSRVRTVVLALGILVASGPARGDDTDRARAQDIAALERVGGYVTPGGLFLPDGLVVGFEGDRAADGDLIHL